MRTSCSYLRRRHWSQRGNCTRRPAQWICWEMSNSGDERLTAHCRKMKNTRRKQHSIQRNSPLKLATPVFNNAALTGSSLHLLVWGWVQLHCWKRWNVIHIYIYFLNEIQVSLTPSHGKLSRARRLLRGRRHRSRPLCHKKKKPLRIKTRRGRNPIGIVRLLFCGKMKRVGAGVG